MLITRYNQFISQYIYNFTNVFTSKKLCTEPLFLHIGIDGTNLRCTNEKYPHYLNIDVMLENSNV